MPEKSKKGFFKKTRDNGAKIGRLFRPFFRWEVAGLLGVFFGLLLLISLVTYDSSDNEKLSRFSFGALFHPKEVVTFNKAGILGAWLAYNFYAQTGFFALVLGLFALVFGSQLFLKKNWSRLYLKVTPFVVYYVLFAVIVDSVLHQESYVFDGEPTFGGQFSFGIASFLSALMGQVGAVVLLLVLALALSVLFKPELLNLKLKKPELPSVRFPTAKPKTGSVVPSPMMGERRPLPKEEKKESGLKKFWNTFKDFGKVEIEKTHPSEAPRTVKAGAAVAAPEVLEPEDTVTPSKKKFSGAAVPVQQESFFRELSDTLKIVKTPDPDLGKYEYPSLALLADPPSGQRGITREEIGRLSDTLEKTLATFGVAIEDQIEAHPGPIITRFEFKPAAGVKINQIVSLADDLALALQAKRIRVVAPIPGKAAVGIEVPNPHPQTVYLKEILASNAFADEGMRLPMAFGKSIGGEAIAYDLAKMPHLLIAGATGSGKSVCLNVLVTSLLYRKHPAELRFIFIDPKMLELSVYAGIPHLERAVVTSPRIAEKVLADAVIEMEERYRALAKASVRNIEDYNRKKKANERLPYLVIVVDELADLMMSSVSTRTETLITRLAQMARAVGIHLVLATQRPSVDVITGLIKANIPARIAFATASSVDSRTILDMTGAEKLLGRGDMLWLAPDAPKPVRAQGVFVSDREMDTITRH
ncbi:MAG TPA: DNA translocase FtsK 4TM domain-containing protein, partial [candidate division Zixibacteria bacterium]|nr:DNA translocase FtsK 4TM domain-containing protein [candidate division Zixibacteria bacterium]